MTDEEIYENTDIFLVFIDQNNSVKTLAKVIYTENADCIEIPKSFSLNPKICPLRV